MAEMKAQFENTTDKCICFCIFCYKDCVYDDAEALNVYTLAGYVMCILFKCEIVHEPDSASYSKPLSSLSQY
jgi:hypothetical protein